jgi:hypothetical protein
MSAGMKCTALPRRECDHVHVESDHGTLFYDVYITRELGLRELVVFLCSPRIKRVQPKIYWHRLYEGESYDPEQIAQEIVQYHWAWGLDDTGTGIVESVDMDGERHAAVRKAFARDWDYHARYQFRDIFPDLFEEHDSYIDPEIVWEPYHDVAPPPVNDEPYLDASEG